MKTVLHIPHSSEHIPSEFLKYFRLSDKDLKNEILKMTDHFTDELFSIEHSDFRKITFPVSRLLCDPERFEDDALEPMCAVGMGCIYEKTHDGRPLKVIECIRQILIKQFYKKHHEKLFNSVDEIISKYNAALIIDCHSFPKNPLPYELNKSQLRRPICLGVDEFHTPKYLIEYFSESFNKYGYSTAINEPFSGSIVPIQFYQKNTNVNSIMIEIRRDLYMDEKLGQKSHGFIDLKNTLNKILCDLDKIV